MNTPPDKDITFVFGSHPTKDPKMRWRASLHFPPGATAGTVLHITLVDGEGTPVEDATFEFAGHSLPVARGHAEIPYADFVAGRHSVPLWLHRIGSYPIPGGLTFE